MQSKAGGIAFRAPDLIRPRVGARPDVERKLIGSMKSEMLAVLEAEDLVLIMMVLKPTDKQESKPPRSEVRSRAASAKAFGV